MTTFNGLSLRRGYLTSPVHRGDSFVPPSIPQSDLRVCHNCGISLNSRTWLASDQEDCIFVCDSCSFESHQKAKLLAQTQVFSAKLESEVAKRILVDQLTATIKRKVAKDRTLVSNWR
jgi:hypothetical protein